MAATARPVALVAIVSVFAPPAKRRALAADGERDRRARDREIVLIAYFDDRRDRRALADDVDAVFTLDDDDLQTGRLRRQERDVRTDESGDDDDVPEGPRDARAELSKLHGGLRSLDAAAFYSGAVRRKNRRRCARRTPLHRPVRQAQDVAQKRETV